MKRWLVLLIPAAVLTVVLAARYINQEAARKRREIGYADALKSYSQALQPGMTRKDVENYLRSKNTKFTWIFTAFGARRVSQTADIVKIGEEAAPWFCSEAYVYVAFEYKFTGIEDIHRQDPSDILERIELFQPYTGCL
jgi:hypothetical protein